MIFLIVGEYKTGKTISAATFPKPMLYLAFDRNIVSISTLKDKSGSPFIKDQDQIEYITMYKDEPADLCFSSERTGSNTPKKRPKHVQAGMEVITKYNKLIGRDGSIFTRSPLPKTLVIDSITKLFYLWKECILYDNQIMTLRIQDYATLEQVLYGMFFPSLQCLLSAGVENIVLIAHTEVEKDEESGKTYEHPVGPSRNMGRQYPKEVEEVYRQVISQGKYQWRTKKSGLLISGSCLNLPDPIEATYQAIEQYIPIKKNTATNTSTS